MSYSPHRSTYLYERTDWPTFRWDASACENQLSGIHDRQRELLNAMERLGFEVRQDTMLSVLVEDVQKSSEIEGELLDKSQVRSSIARRLGMDVSGLPVADRDVEGVVEMMLNATQRYLEPLNAERLFGWHSALFPTGRSGMSTIVTGAWRNDRDGPMQVVSGAIGKEKVHFEAPRADLVASEMASFVNWFENERLDPVLKAALAHLWFVTIHPFDDGNGRIARAITDMALARFDGTSQRFYSMSAQICEDREGYYSILERTQKASMDITAWVQWFMDRLDDALNNAGVVLEIVRVKVAFWNRFGAVELNDRQRKVLNRVLDGFQGGLQTSKYAKLAKCSTDTALRDLSDLVLKGVLRRDDTRGGRSTVYELG